MTKLLDHQAMRQRREAYREFTRKHAADVFKPDGTYRPSTENDPALRA